MGKPCYRAGAAQVNRASKAFSFPLGPRLLTVRGGQYAAGYVPRGEWAYLPVGAPVFVRLKRDTCPLLPACVTRNAMTTTGAGASGGLSLRLRPSLACKAIVHRFPADQIRVLFLAVHHFPPLTREA